MCSLIIERRYSGLGVGSLIMDALSPENSYKVEDKDAMIAILDNADLNALPHTWGAASFKARVERLKPQTLKHEQYVRYVLDHYVGGSVCYI